MSSIHPARLGAALLALLAPLPAAAATYYVAPTGSDAAAGTTDAAPFATVAQTQRVVKPGDTVMIHGGMYVFSGTTGTVGVPFSVNGTAALPINYFAFPGEIPIFDLFNLAPQARVTGLDVNCNFIHIRGLEVRGVQQRLAGSDSWGVRIQGNGNVIEAVNSHDNQAAGFFITSGANNLILNCDSHNNYDPLENGGNGDGFGCHSSGGNNVIDSCRAYDDSDDGFDFINASGTCIVQNSMAFRNGYVPGTLTTAGNGNGFKAGGYGLVASATPANPPVHVVRNCLAFSNRAAGFYVNHHPAAIQFYNNTSYANHPGFDLLGVAADGVTALNIGLLRNNIAFSGTLLSNNTGARVDESFNSWDAATGVTVGNTSFVSVSLTGLDGPRQADGSLPLTTNFHLATVTGAASLVDKGTPVGLPFVGAAPDLGAFELGAVTGSGGATGTGGTPGTGGAVGGTGGRVGGTGGTVGGTGGRIGGAGGSVGGGAGGSVGGGAGGSVGTGSGGSTTSTSAGGSSGGGPDASGSGEITGATSLCSCDVGGGGGALGWIVLSLLAMVMAGRRRSARAQKR